MKKYEFFPILKRQFFQEIRFDIDGKRLLNMDDSLLKALAFGAIALFAKNKTVKKNAMKQAVENGFNAAENDEEVWAIFKAKPHKIEEYCKSLNLKKVLEGEKQTSTDPRKVPGDFSGFLEKFASDPDFQMNRIVFPLRVAQ